MVKPRGQRFKNNPDDVFCAEVERPHDAVVTTSSRKPPPAHLEQHRLLSNAVIDGRVDVLRSLLVDGGLDVNARSSTGATAGHQAAIEGRVEEMDALICHGLDIDAVDDEGNTALHLASRHGRGGVARRLAEAIPNEELRNCRGFTALDESIQAGRTGCADCVRDFTYSGKAHALQQHFLLERDRLEKARRKREILFGRDLDVCPRDEEFRSLRTCPITAGDRALICTSLQASAVAKRCIAAGLRCAETALAGRGRAKAPRRHAPKQSAP